MRGNIIMEGTSELYVTSVEIGNLNSISTLIRGRPGTMLHIAKTETNRQKILPQSIHGATKTSAKGLLLNIWTESSSEVLWDIAISTREIGNSTVQSQAN